jgi:hypothetical protein
MATPVGQQGKVFEQLIAHRQNLSARQAEMVRAAPQEQQEFLTAQFKLQNETEGTSTITRLLKEDSRENILNNL